MATTYKVLGQAAPAATALTDLYVTPAATETVISSIIITNRGALPDSYRLAVLPFLATLGNQHYITYDVAISPEDSTTLTLGITMSAGDKIIAYPTGSNLSFNVFGMEIA
jgi:hypothetical protein